MGSVGILFVSRMTMLAWLVVADLLFGQSMQKKRYFILRMFFSTLFAFLLVGLLSYANYRVGVYLAFHVSRLGHYAAINVVTHLLIYAINFTILLVSYKEKVITIIFSSIAGYCMMSCAMALNNVLVSIAPSLSFLQYEKSTGWSFIVWFFCYVLTYAAVYYTFGSTLSKTKSVAEFYSHSTIALFFVVLVVTVIVWSGSIVYRYYSSILYILMNFVIIVANSMFLVVLYLFTKSLIAKTESDALLHMKDIRLKQYETIKENIDIINEKCHDLKHQLLALKGQSSIDSEYLHGIEQSIQIYDTMVNTGSKALDIVITDKKLLCSKEGIEMTVIADGEKLSFMSEVDIYSLFGNALDNAVEYLRKVDRKNRFLKLEISEQGNMVSISIRNYYEGLPIESEKDLKTSKPDQGWHGFGVKSIKKITESYGGSCLVHSEGNSFILSILILV